MENIACSDSSHNCKDLTLDAFPQSFLLATLSQVFIPRHDVARNYGLGPPPFAEKFPTAEFPGALFHNAALRPE